jgi:hypothetical protein
MGHWGVKSYEIDEANDAIDAGFDRVHGSVYDDLMDDRNPLTYDQVIAKLANEKTLAAAIEVLEVEFGADREQWDEVARLAFAGIVVRHAELKVPIDPQTKALAISYLRDEAIEWEEATARKIRREKEIGLLQKS